MTIFKYQLEAYPTQHYIKRGAKFLCVQTQRNLPQMWFLVDEKETEDEQRNFVARGTGEAFLVAGPEKYLGTFQLDGGSLVFHLFELIP